MIAVNLQVRPALSSDQQQIADLMFFEAHVHRHLDWRAPLDWLGFPHYWVMEERERILAALACPQEPPGMAWIRLFTYASLLSGPEAWMPLWNAVRAEMALRGDATVAAITMHPWFQSLLRDSGFELHQQIVLMEWNAGAFTPQPISDGIRIRQMVIEDLPAIAEVDADAFDLMWRNSRQALQKAFSMAVSATVAEQAGSIAGYQISTGNPLGAHLARLAVRKEAQGNGIGTALVSHLIAKLRERGLTRLSVNTQADNAASLALYRRMGFVHTGERYPVFACQVRHG